MNDTTIEAIQALEHAESNEEILLALEPLTGKARTQQSLAVVAAAGEMLASNIEEDE